jgi:TolB-like protein
VPKDNDSKARIELLGGFEIVGPRGAAIEISGRKPRALMAILALSPDLTTRRQRLVDLLWSDRANTQARSSLRQALLSLKRDLAAHGLDIIVTDGDRVGLAVGRVDVDAFDFARLAADGKAADAAALYRGPLLDGFLVGDVAFEDWAREERRKVEELAVGAFEDVLKETPAGGRVAPARRLLAVDPLREASHRLLIEALMAAGERDQALRHYEACRRALKEELDVEPESETVRLYEVLSGRTGRAEAPTAVAFVGGSVIDIRDKPTIAVLPFTNMSGDPAQEFFSDGVSEDIITALSKLSKLFVVARNSTFIYKGRAIDVRQVGREQGVRYVLEGSVQCADSRLRITAQLVDAQRGHHIWAQRYDRAAENVFELQDEITREVISALQVELTDGEQARLWAGGTKVLEAWELIVQIPELLHSHRRADALPARRLAERALLLDPHYATAWAMLGWSYWNDAFNGWTEELETSLDRAVDAMERARSIDDSNPDTLALLAFLHLSLRRFDEAYRFSERAMLLGPSNSFAAGVAANVALFCGRPRDMEPLLRKAMRLCPVYPAWYVGDLAYAYLYMDRRDEAIATAREALRIDPDYIYTYYVLAIAFSELGRTTEAGEAVDNILRIEPRSAVSTIARTQPFQDTRMRDRQLDGLRKAGLPERPRWPASV